MNNNANLESFVKALSALVTAQPDGSLVITFGDAASAALDNDQTSRRSQRWRSRPNPLGILLPTWEMVRSTK